MSNHQSSYSEIVYKLTRRNSAQSWLKKIRKSFHMTSRKQTVQGECFMNEQQPNSPGHEDRLE